MLNDCEVWPDRGPEAGEERAGSGSSRKGKSGEKSKMIIFCHLLSVEIL